MRRLFLGLPIPDEHRDALFLLQRKLPAGRPVPWENFHITLVFLGDVSDLSLQELHDDLQTSKIRLSEISIQGFGHFGGSTPRAIWAGVEAGSDLQDAAARLSSCGRRVGLSIQKRRFVPHVTLTRFREGDVDSRTVAGTLGSLGSFKLPPFQPYAFSLFQSQLRPEGPHYTELESYPITPSQTI